MSSLNEQEELEKYLADKNDFDIYIELTQKYECRNTFAPLEFFKIRDSINAFWEKNFYEPKMVINYFESLELTNKQRAYLCLHFINYEYFELSGKDDNWVDIFYLTAEHFSDKYHELDFDFNPEETANIKRWKEIEEDRAKSISELPETIPPQEIKEGTLPRKVLAMHYLLEHCNVKGVDQSKKAALIEFLTGGNYKNIYDHIRNPLMTKTGKFRREDLQFIRPFFENLGMEEIVKSINKELQTPDL